MSATIRRRPLLGFISLLFLCFAALLGPALAHAAARTTGEIAARVYACPEEMRPETMVGDVCDLLADGYDLALTTPAGATLTLADATRDGGIVTWSGLAFGTYTLTQTRLPSGHDVSVVDGPTPGPGTITLDAAAPHAAAAVYAFKPDPAAASLTIHNRLCPDGHAGVDLYRDCHGTPAGPGLEFVATAVPTGTPTAVPATGATTDGATDGVDTVTRATDLAGNVTFSLPPGTYDVRGGVPGDFARLNLFCAPAAAPGTPAPAATVLRGGVRGPNDPTGVRLVLAAGDAIVCDWYNTPESQRG